jgi:hypothetical protein
MRANHIMLTFCLSFCPTQAQLSLESKLRLVSGLLDSLGATLLRVSSAPLTGPMAEAGLAANKAGLDWLAVG